jgi:hypothetical protein
MSDRSNNLVADTPLSSAAVIVEMPITSSKKIHYHETYKADITEHQLSADAVECLFDTNLSKGLSQAAATERLIRDGLNALTPPKKKHWVWKALAHIAGVFTRLVSIMLHPLPSLISIHTLHTMDRNKPII